MENTGERLLTDTLDQSTIIEHLHRYAFALQFVKDKYVVDIASGEGYGVNLLANIAQKVIGIDIDKEAIEHARKKYLKKNNSFLQGSADNIHIETETVDVVTSFETIEHHDRHQEMIREIKRILKPAGILIISSPDKSYYSPDYINPYHVKELFFEEFKSLIENNFNHSIFLNQKVSYSSLIIQEESNEFYEFSGDFNAIKKKSGINNPIYNIAVASQHSLPPLFSSSFDGENILSGILRTMNELNNDYQTIYSKYSNSISNKIKRFPARLFRKIKRVTGV